MAFSSIFVVTNSLRLRGFDVQKLAKPKPLARQLVELAPRLVAPAVALAVLIAISVGWLMPAQAKGAMGEKIPGRTTITYRAFIDQTAPIVPGQWTKLKIEILDQFGKPFNDFDTSPVGQIVNVRVVSRDLAFLAAVSQSMSPGSATGMGGMGGAASVAPTPKGTPAPPVKRAIQPEMVFPADGQYVVFVDFWPRGGDEVVLSVPLAVGSVRAPEAVLTPDASLTQTVGDLRVTLKSNGPLKANQYNYIDFDVIDAQGQLRSDEIQLISGNLAHLDIVDENLTTLVRPDFLDRHKLRFSAYFPKPGKYKVWFSFYYDSSF